MWQVHHFLTILSFLFGIYLISRLLLDRKAPGSTIAWLLLMILIPYLGVPLYLALGGRKIRRRALKKGSLYTPISLCQMSTQISQIESILLSSGAPLKTFDNNVEIILSGEHAFSELTNLIQSAQSSIYIMTFILGRDKVGDEILNLLIKKAQNGVEVRLLLDGLGSFWVSRRILKLLKRAGGKVSFFLPIIHIPFFGHSNLRNHRKIVVIDKKFALIGGMNLAEEYLGPPSTKKRWADLALKIEGGAVKDLDTIFQLDWEFATGEKASPWHQSAQARIGTAVKHYENSTIQVVASGPDVLGDPLYDSLLSAIFLASQRIWIVTPYFIPDESFAKALELASRRGVDVCLFLPKKSNHFLADMSRGSYLRQLELAGGKLYFYLPGMLHAKMIIIDDKFAVLGSANFDMRSLLLNYEIGVFIYSYNEINLLIKWLLQLQIVSQRACLNKNWKTDIMDGIGRIIGPML